METTTKSGAVRTAFRRAAATALAAALLAGMAAPGAAGASSAAVPTEAAGQHRPELQRAIEELVDSGITGVQLRVRDERGTWAGSAGARELGAAAKPPTNGRFRVGSATKTFTSTVVLQLVDEGEIGLDEPVADYLPDLGLDDRITVRMLLQHTSGLFAYTGELNEDGSITPGIPVMGKEWVDNRFHTYQPEELVRFALSKPLRFEPGTRWSYSNTNYTLAVLLIEAVTGNSYTREIDRRIVRPLGLKGTVAPGASPQIRGPHAHGYYRYDDGGRIRTIDIARQNPSWLAGAGDMISTTEDLGTFMSALMDGELVSALLLDQMRTPHPLSGAYQYGLGLFVTDLGLGCGVVISHNGGVPGYATMMYSTPDGSKTVTGSLTYVEEAGQPPTEVAQEWVARLVQQEFCGS